MHALLLAAGVGQRLGAAAQGRPKCLLEIGGRSLLARHVAALHRCGVRRLTVCTGFHAPLVEAALAAEIAEMAEMAGAAARPAGALALRLVHNPEFRRGSVVSLATAFETLVGGEPVLLMDADVLYHPGILRRLTAPRPTTARHESYLLLDRGFEPGDEPVKCCLADGRIVEFRKRLAPGLVFDGCGESVGFFRLAPAAAAALAHRAAGYVRAGRLDEPYEEAIRDLILAARLPFGVEEVTGLPWIEIDFPEDVAKARGSVWPQIQGAWESWAYEHA